MMTCVFTVIFTGYLFRGISLCITPKFKIFKSHEGIPSSERTVAKMVGKWTAGDEEESRNEFQEVGMEHEEIKRKETKANVINEQLPLA